VHNAEWFQLFLDVSVLVEIAKKLPESSRRGNQALFTANQLANALWTDDDSTLGEARALARTFFAQRNGEAQFEVSAIGHCHIDTAWLWPYRETRRKCGRSWATALRYMDETDRYPEYRFAASQAQQLQWVKEDYPGLFERLRGSERFVPTGGSWVEFDCNLPSGESFCRQFLYGQRFFKREFGQVCKVFWLPDTFGYASQLPQLVRGAEMQYFLTQKLSWNLINKFPYSTFYWEGLDGTHVLTHFPPASTYCAKVTVEEVVNTAEQYHERDRSNDALLVFGHGDGGGGPQVCISVEREDVKRGFGREKA
jgi:alpha-mannosidase